MRFKFMGLGRRERGYTIIELLIVAAIIGILLAIAIPNLIKARISANEANARKAMQTLRDAEAEFFEQDQDDNGVRDYTDLIGGIPADAAVQGSLRCPNSDINPCTEQDALVDSTFFTALAAADGTTAATSDCAESKAGYCLGWTSDSDDGINDADWAEAGAGGSDPILEADFGWETSPTSVQKTGRKDFGIWGDGVIRCTASTVAGAAPGTFQTSRDGSDGTAVGACD
jgi:prepilin-type N-terminal cleavage/methylation domain-containing protein